MNRVRKEGGQSAEGAAPGAPLDVAAPTPFGRGLNSPLGDSATLRSLEAVTDPAISSLSHDEFLDALLLRTKEVMGGDVAAVLLTEVKGAVLRVRAASGATELAPVGREIPLGEDTFETVAQWAHQPLVISDASAAELGHIVAAQPGLRSLMVAPLCVQSKVIGIIEVGSTRGGAFDEVNGLLLQVVADRCASSIDRARLEAIGRRSRLGADRAQLYLEVLARGETALGKALESYDLALEELGNVVVPDFADWFAADLPRPDSELRRVGACWAMDGRVVGRSVQNTDHRHPKGDQLVQLAMAEGRPQVVMRTARLDLAEMGAHFHRPEDFGPQPPDVESMLVVPVRVRDAYVGALSFVTGPGRRAYRPSDLDTAKELARRVGVAVERVASYRELREAGKTAQRYAERLQKLVRAALEVNAQLGEADVLELLVEHAQQVLDARVVVVSGHPGGGPVLERVWPPVQARDDHPREDEELSKLVADTIAATAECGTMDGSDLRPGDRSGSVIAVPMVNSGGEVERTVVAIGAPDRDYGPEDESVLTLLSQMASVAVQNARLYADRRANEHRLEAVIQSSPLAIAEFDLSGAARWWNRAAGELFGWDDIEGPRRVGVRDGSGAILDELWDRARGGEATIGASLAAVGPSGNQLELSVSTSPVNDTETVTGMLLVAEDVTERRRMLDQVHQAERLSAMTRMAGAVAHDFNNLLTVILGCSDILLRQVEDNEELVQDVSAIQRAGTRAAELTSQLVRIGQHRPFQPEIVVVDDLLGLMGPMLSGVLGEQIAVHLACGSNSAPVLIDRAELERSVLNLAINARDAMPEGGTLAVRTVDAAGRRPGDPRTVEISFSDTGIGMDAQTAAHCFEPFFTTKGRARGSGLGLATVHAVVTQAGGEVGVETAPGQGTCFTIRLPRSEPSDAPAADEPVRPGVVHASPVLEEPVAQSRVVLVVDDEPEVLRLTIRQLERHALDVLGVADAGSALATLHDRNGAIDLLITDVVMPSMNGIELAAVVKQDYPGMAVLFLSGHLDEEVGTPWQLPHGAPLLAKPFTAEELSARVVELLNLR